MIETLARKRMHVVALAAMIALVAALFAVVGTTKAVGPAGFSAAISIADESDNVVKAGSTIRLGVTSSYSIEVNDDLKDPAGKAVSVLTQVTWRISTGDTTAADAAALTRPDDGGTTDDNDDDDPLTGADAVTWLNENVGEALGPISYAGFTLRVSGVFEFETGPTEGDRDTKRMAIAGQDEAAVICTYGGEGTVTGTTALTADNVKATDGIVTQTCTLLSSAATDTTPPTHVSIVIPKGTPDGDFTISTSVDVVANTAADGANATNTLDLTNADPASTVNVAGEGSNRRSPELAGKYRNYTPLAASLKVTVGDVNAIDSATFGLATGSKDAISKNDSTNLEIGALNANGKAVDPGAIAAIVVSSTAGSLTSSNNENCSGLSCQIDISALTQTGATSTAKIPVTFTAPNKSGSAEINVRILSKAGQTLTPDPITITYAGAPASLAIAEPTSTVLNKATAAVDEGDDDTDTRDTIKLVVTASDEGGNKVGVPANGRSVKVKDSEGKTVSSGASATFSASLTSTTNDDDEEVKLEAVIKVTSATAIDAGDYTVEVKARGLDAATQTITLAGEVANVSVSLSGDQTLLSTVTVTATVTDANGASAADGSVVTWNSGAVSGTAGTVVSLLKADGKTKGGMAEAEYLIVSAGSAFITASAGGVNGVAVVSVAGADAADRGPSLSDFSGSSGLVSYSGPDATASELMALLAGRASSIWLSVNGSWVLYANVDGAMVPGSSDFTVTSGDVLYISN